MTNKEKKIMADLIDSCLDACAYFNMKAQTNILGLSESDDNLRQKLCNAASAATGKIYCGNLQRTHEAQLSIDLVNHITD